MSVRHGLAKPCAECEATVGEPCRSKARGRLGEPLRTLHRSRRRPADALNADDARRLCLRSNEPGTCHYCGRSLREGHGDRAYDGAGYYWPKGRPSNEAEAAELPRPIPGFCTLTCATWFAGAMLDHGYRLVQREREGWELIKQDRQERESESSTG